LNEDEGQTERWRGATRGQRSTRFYAGSGAAARRQVQVQQRDKRGGTNTRCPLLRRRGTRMAGRAYAREQVQACRTRVCDDADSALQRTRQLSAPFLRRHAII